VSSQKEPDVGGEKKLDGVTDYKRPNWDEYFFEIMRAIAKRGTCSRGRSGCVIAKDKQLISAGYVGSPVGEDHCDDVGHLFQKRYNADGSYSIHCVRTIHAEQNAICQAAKRGISIEGATLYCHMTPCPVCAKMIVNSGIKKVVCLKRYHDGAEAEKLFMRTGIALVYASEEEEKYENKGGREESRNIPQNGQEKTTPPKDIKLKVKKLSDDIGIPSYVHAGDAGIDLKATEEIEIPSGSRAKIATGLAFEIPEGNAGLIWDRSGLSSKKGLKVMGGVIDSGYRGEIFVTLANVSREPVIIAKGEKIAQILIQEVKRADIEIADDLSQSEREDKGFGSSDYPVGEVLEEIDYLPEEELESEENYDEEINLNGEENEIQSRW